MSAKPTVSRTVLPVAWARVVLCSALVGVLVSAAGCSTGWGGHYRWSDLAGKQYFNVQLVVSGETAGDGDVVPVASLLLLEPVGDISDGLAENIHQALWQELQQILPGSIRTPARNSLYARYLRESNLVAEDGGIAMDEVVQIGRAAGVSHVLGVRIAGYRPYHPQRLIMEWVLVDVDKQQKVLVLSGALDAAEHEVRCAAVSYFKKRRAEKFTEESLDVMLRSPREYSRFAVVQAVDALRKKICSQHAVLRP